MAEFTVASIEQRRNQLQQQIADKELQLAGRERDLEGWRLFSKADLPLDPEEADERIRNNRDEECKAQIAAAIKDTVQLGIVLGLLRRDLAALTKTPSASKAVAKEASKQ